LIITVALGGLHRTWPANRLPVLSSKVWRSGSICKAVCEISKNPCPEWEKLDLLIEISKKNPDPGIKAY
jgi:hypothetical protein